MHFCLKCGKEGSSKDFYSDLRNEHGLTNSCKQCRRAYAKEYYKGKYQKNMTSELRENGFKLCRSCLTTKPHSAFTRNGKYYKSKCKQCRRKGSEREAMSKVQSNSQPNELLHL